MSVYDSKESLIRDRMLEILAALQLQYPSLSVTIDLWRPKVVTPSSSGFADEGIEVWIRLDENVPAFFVETMERWYEEAVGIINQNTNYIILPAGHDLEPDDHIILNGESWMVIDSAEQAGISKLKVDKQKSRFKAPSRVVPVYRELGMKARIA
jgi:hypothetical protein